MHSPHHRLGTSYRHGSISSSISIGSSRKNYPFDNSFNLVVLGDLHMEDDMTCHEEVREDCITALKNLSVFIIGC